MILLISISYILNKNLVNSLRITQLALVLKYFIYGTWRASTNFGTCRVLEPMPDTYQKTTVY